MLSIGEFSHVCRVSIKTLRYYQELGILVPARIDEESGYRFYDAANHERMSAISVLKDLGFTLKEISSILQTCKDDQDLQEFIDCKLDEVDRKLRNLSELREQLHNIRNSSKQSEQQNNKRIQEFHFHLDCYAARAIQGPYKAIGEGFTYLYKTVGRFAKGKPYAFYSELEYQEEEARFKAVFELRKSPESAGTKNQSEKKQINGVEINSFPKTRAVKLVHNGPYGTQGLSYSRLFSYCREKEYKIKPPIIEHYVRGPGMIFQGNPRQYQTECILLIKD
jgi:DNA-binding transcriptional MerR regulator/effector-binding domain-containing protein